MTEGKSSNARRWRASEVPLVSECKQQQRTFELRLFPVLMENSFEDFVVCSENEETVMVFT